MDFQTAYHTSGSVQVSWLSSRKVWFWCSQKRILTSQEYSLRCIPCRSPRLELALFLLCSSTYLWIWWRNPPRDHLSPHLFHISEVPPGESPPQLWSQIHLHESCRNWGGEGGDPWVKNWDSRGRMDPAIQSRPTPSSLLTKLYVHVWSSKFLA